MFIELIKLNRLNIKNIAKADLIFGGGFDECFVDEFY
jgi:hypothetical protein